MKKENKDDSSHPTSSVIIDSALGATSGALVGATTSIGTNVLTGAFMGSAFPFFGTAIGGVLGLRFWPTAADRSC